MKVECFSFPNQPSETEYCLFSEQMEGDEYVLFHATSVENFDNISREGFKPKEPLKSVTFTKKSSTALDHACKNRSGNDPDWMVIAVRYNDFARPGIVHEPFGLYDYTCDPQPEIVSYCKIPATYRYI